MSKVIMFCGSPHKSGPTALLLEEVAKGAESKGAEVVKYDLNDKDIQGCQACYACKKEDAEACIQKDYLQPMYADIKEADGIVVGSPIYMATFTGQTWIWIDRLYPAMSSDFKPRFPGKNVATVITQGAPDANLHKPAIGGAQGFFKGLGWNLVGDLVWAGAGEAKGEIPEELKKEAFAAGESLVK